MSDLTIPPDFEEDFHLTLTAQQEYQFTGLQTWLDKAAAAWKRIVNAPSFCTMDNWSQSVLLDDAGNFFWQHYLNCNRIDVLDDALNCWRRAVSEASGSNCLFFQNNLAVGLRERFKRIGRRSDLDEAIQFHEIVVEQTPPDSSDFPAFLNNLGLILNERFLQQGDPKDLDQAITAFKDAVEKTPDDSPKLYSRLNNLGTGLNDRYEWTGHPEDLDAAIGIFYRVVQNAPVDSPYLPAFFNDLGNALCDRFRLNGSSEDLKKGLQLLQSAVEKTPQEASDLPSRISNLGNGLCDRFNQTGKPEDLAEAIRLLEQAVQMTPEGSPAFPKFLNNLSNGLSSRYNLTGQLEDLEKAIQSLERAVNNTPANSSVLPRRFNNLGNILLDRYDLTAQQKDLAKAIKYFTSAVELASAHASELPTYYNNLSNCLRERFKLTGRLDDLEESIRVSKQAVKETSEDSPLLPAFLNNLGIGLFMLFGRTRNQDTLDEAISSHERSIKKTPTDSPDLPLFLNNLSTGLYERSRQTNQNSDLETAIRSCEQAVSQISAESTGYAALLNSLALGLQKRFALEGRSADLKSSIHVSRQAVSKTPADSPSLPNRLFNLGNGLRLLFIQTKRPEDRDEAVCCFRRACELATLYAPQTVVNVSRSWGQWAFERNQWDEAVEAYTFGLASGQQIFTRQLMRAHKENTLSDLQDIPRAAAYALAKLNKLQDAAVTIECGRARLLAEALHRNRRDLEDLPRRGYSHLFQRYQEIVKIQEGLTQKTTASSEQSDQKLTQRRLNAIIAAQNTFEQTVVEIRKIRDYENFLIEPTFSEIKSAAPDSPLVYLLTTSAGGLCLMIYRDNAQAVWLDALTDAVVQDWLQGPDGEPSLGGWLGAYKMLKENQQEAWENWFTTIDDVCRQLGARVMQPVIAALRTMLSDSQPYPSEVTVIPLGLLAYLPLHASWIEDPYIPGVRRYLVDDLAIRYAPSALAMYHARQIAESVPAEQMLAVKNPSTVHAPPLKNVHEVSIIAKFFNNPAILSDVQATRQAVCSALPQAQVVHFACHAHHDWHAPLNSGLLMSDHKCGDVEMLSVRDLLLIKGAGGRLVTLAACETGLVGTALPDEVVMLSSALLQAGFGGVVASLWPVDDLGTSLLMERFYRLWREEGLSPTQALRAAQHWLRDTTNEEKAGYFNQNNPDIFDFSTPENAAAEFYAKILSREMSQRDFEHPYWWAAFYLTGN